MRCRFCVHGDEVPNIHVDCFNFRSGPYHSICIRTTITSRCDRKRHFMTYCRTIVSYSCCELFKSRDCIDYLHFKPGITDLFCEILDNFVNLFFINNFLILNGIVNRDTYNVSMIVDLGLNCIFCQFQNQFVYQHDNNNCHTSSLHI